MSTPPSSSSRARARRGPSHGAGHQPAGHAGRPQPASPNRNGGQPSGNRNGGPQTGGRNGGQQPGNRGRFSEGRSPESARPAAPRIALPPIDVPTGPGSFAELGVPHALCETLARQGLLSAFPIQTATLPDALSGRDVLGQGRTGSGKTLAFALPIVARLMNTKRTIGDRRPRALVLVPTRELASQVEAVVKPLAAAAGLRTATVFGGVGAAPQIAALRAGTEIIIGCPGRLADHLGTGALDLGAIEITVLDEADHMADVGFLPTVRRLMDRTPKQGQRLLFSATLAGGVDQVVRQYMDDPVSHAVATEAPVEMTHHVVVVNDADRVAVVAGLARSHRVLVFTRTKHRAKQLTKRLASDGLAAVELHGNLSQNARTKNLDAFSGGAATALVATDIAARGIHVDEVPLVVHADPPMEHKAYVHRSGRTARAGATGTVLTIATTDQVHEVRDLLRRADITATWSQLPAGATDASDVLNGGGVRYELSAGRGPSSGGGRPASSGRPAGGGRSSSDRGRPAGGGRSSSGSPSSAGTGRGPGSHQSQTRGADGASGRPAGSGGRRRSSR